MSYLSFSSQLDFFETILSVHFSSIFPSSWHPIPALVYAQTCTSWPTKLHSTDTGPLCGAASRSCGPLRAPAHDLSAAQLRSAANLREISPLIQTLTQERTAPDFQLVTPRLLSHDSPGPPRGKGGRREEGRRGLDAAEMKTVGSGEKAQARGWSMGTHGELRHFFVRVCFAVYADGRRAYRKFEVWQLNLKLNSR